MTILSRDPSAKVTQLDWPNVNAVAQKLNQERGLGWKIRFIDGEHHTAESESSHYDMVLASNFVVLNRQSETKSCSSRLTAR